jgi:transposase-like protein
MRSILSKILTFRQHSDTLLTTPEKYKPSHCPYCYSIKLYNHGVYFRKPDRHNIGKYSCNELAVTRYKCTEEYCGRTCSTLPECFSPRRWYPWVNQQWCLWFLLAGYSINQVDKLFPMARSTIVRWKNWLSDRFSLFQRLLKNKFPEFGYFENKVIFWSTWLDNYSLSHAMVTLNNQQIVIP